MLAALVAAFLLSLTLAPGQARAAIAFVAASSNQNAAGATTLSLSPPTGVAEGQLLFATVAAAGTGTFTAPTGWTEVKGVTQGSALRQTTYYKVATASEPSSYSWGLGTSRSASGGIVSYNGVNTSVPIDATAAGTGASGNATAPSVTTSAASDQILELSSFATSTTVTPASGATERFEISSSSTTTETADFSQASAGATAAGTVTPATSTAAWIAQTVALREAGQASLALASSAAPSFSASLDSGDTSATYTVPLTLNDTRTGGGAGWNATITSTQFTTTGSKTLSTSASQVTGVTATCNNGGICTAPTNSIAFPVTVPAGSTAPAAVKFYNAAAATGRGNFTVTPTVKVTVPQNSFSGTYTSTLTLSVVSGP